LLTSVIADKFKETAHNKPWLKEPIMYVQRTSKTTSEASESPIRIHVLIDSRKGEITDSDLYIRGIMMPTDFAK